MSEAGAARHTDELEWQRVLQRLRQDSPEQHLPPLGMEVAGYRLETKLGRGGQGTVFRARREGRQAEAQNLRFRVGVGTRSHRRLRFLRSPPGWLPLSRL